MKKILPLFLFAACTSTHLPDVYHNPMAIYYTFDKPVAIVFDRDPAVRKQAEDELAKQIGPQAVASYTILSPADQADAAALLAKLQSAGIDGAVTMRILPSGVQPITKTNAPELFKGFTTYVGGLTQSEAEWQGAVRIETAIFDVKRNDLLWSATTAPFEAKDPAQAVALVAKPVRQELTDSKLRGKY